MIKKINFLVFLYILFSNQVFATSVLIWDENKDAYGHAAVQTRTYHMSFWPDGAVKTDFGVWKTITEGCPASLNYHHHLDYRCEGDVEPTKVYDLVGISESKVNAAYEEMLDYNNITPDLVTLETAKEIMKKDKDKRPEISLGKSLYTFLGTNFGRDEFYKYPQSCTSFSLSVLIAGGLTYKTSDVVIDRYGSQTDVIRVYSFKNVIENYINPKKEKDCSIQ